MKVSPAADYDYVVAYVPTGYEREQQEDNARLIAAAPELLEALKQITDALHTGIRHGFTPGLKPENHIAIQEALAAIAKAEGRS